MVRVAMRQAHTNQAQPTSTKQVQHRGGVIGGIDQQSFTRIMEDVALNPIPVDRALNYVNPGRHVLRNRLPRIDRDLFKRLSA
jgi:hypothetical protein